MSHGEQHFTLSEGSAGEEFGPYVVYERLGIGGMATVHRAKKRGLAGFERGVALKRMLPNLSQDVEFINSFVREAKLASLLAHPNIAQIYDFGRIGNTYFIAMEHVEGLDVTKLLRYSYRHNARPTLDVVLSILCELCEALEYAHTFVDENGQPQCIVHRDVSPSNLIVAQTGHLKVIDFGIAKANARPHHTESGRVKGKLGYMAPEALDGRPVGPASDVFSAGVVAYELLTAEKLFQAKSDYDLLRHAREAEIPPPSRRNPGVPTSLDRVVLSALERDERRRTQTAGEFRKALEQVAIEAGIRFSSSDVTAWWAKAATTGEHPGARESSPVSSPSAAQRRSVPPVPPRPMTGMYSPSSVELSGSQHEEDLADRSARRIGAGSLAEPLRGSRRAESDAQPPLPLGSVDGLPGELPLEVGSIRPSPAAPPRSRSRKLFVIALGLCTVAAGLAAYQFAVRPTAAVAPVLAAAPSSPPQPALVKFIVRPEDSVVEVGGKEVSRHSPCEIPLERGVYSVAVSHPGNKRWTSQILLHDGESQTVNVALEPATAIIRLSSEPTGLVAQLDGRPLGQVTPAEFEISVGPHRLVVVGATRTWAQDFVAATDGTYAFHAALPTAKHAPAVAPSGAVRTTPPAPERTPQRASAGNAVRMPAAREPVVEPEERVIEPGAAPSVKTLAKAESPFLPVPQPDAAIVSTLAPPQPAVRSSAPPLVPASTVTKLSGDLPATQNASGSADVYSKICIGIDGHVSSVKIIKASAGIAAELQRTLLGWRYKPYVDASGQPSPACFAMNLRLVFERAH
jgi:serine/threonine protein kinase